MEITITVTKEQLELIENFKPASTFEKELLDYANGLVAFYVGKGQQVLDEKEIENDAKRLEALKKDEILMAQVDLILKEEV